MFRFRRIRTQLDRQRQRRIRFMRRAKIAHQAQQRDGFAPSPRAKRPTTIARYLPNWWGAIGANIASWIALGPSFLPRTWWMTAGSVALAQIYGYAVGSGARSVRSLLRIPARRLLHLPNNPTFPATLNRIWRWTSVLTMSAGTVVALLRSIPRQREIARRIGVDEPSTRTQIVGMAAGTAFASAIFGWLTVFRLQSHSTKQLLRRFAPALAAPFSGTLITFGLTYYLNRSILWQRLMERLKAAAHAKNLSPLPGRVPPEQSERSGSAASLEPFNTLGRHGKAIVSDGPRGSDIAAYWGEPALEPIRAYVGLRAQVSIPDAAKRAVAELKRAGGFDRDVICIKVGTGTGWLNDWSMAAIEYLTRGNCAVVSLQYTVLTSSLALLVDRNSPKLTGQALYREVMAEIETLPADQRPKIVMSGESLGAFGGLSVFDDAADMMARLDGAVWAGCPQIAAIWQELTEAREPGSLEILPRIGDGSRIRFSNRTEDLHGPVEGEPYAAWADDSRFIFLQHPSDPVVWGSTSMIWREPQWMRETRGHDVTAHWRWWPWVTFWQIVADSPMSISTPGGHAHRYFEEYVGAWAEVLGVTGVDADALAAEIRLFIHPH
ncbi:alpha/beta-hydrolase family protein [Gulosibacter bifidus]|uniref:Alpha/beta-hydrolase family protein n=1 Tax=Gulosibacter bifidus TaxID=272239 RepID=A0ABW5RIY6_9MICO|nr:alpha/beta-hydrolase family protein [Gulosibacter bifidus]